MRKIILALAFVTASQIAAGQEQLSGNWRKSTFTGRFTDKTTTIFWNQATAVSSSSAYVKPNGATLLLTCVGGLKVVYSPNVRLYRYLLRYRFDKRPEQTAFDEFPRDGAWFGAGSVRFSQLLNWIETSQTLITRVWSDSLGGAIEADFNLEGAKEAVTAYRAICKEK